MSVRLRAIMRKEFIHIRRDPRSLAIIFLLPAMMILLYGYAINMDVKHVALGVYDPQPSAASRSLAQAFIHSGYFDQTAVIHSRAEIAPLIERRAIKAALVIPDDFTKSIRTRPRTAVQVVVDGGDATTATVVLNYAEMILTSYAQALNAERIGATVVPEPRVWYNPDLESVNFVVPGLMAIILMMICALLTSITIAREKETGTLEQILVSPVRSGEIIVGKVLPYVLLAFADGLLVLLFGRFWFGIPIRGSAALLMGLSVVYLFCSLSIGLLISTVARTQQVAMMAAQIGTTLPTLILSGFIFPIASMPKVLQVLSYLIPAKYYLTIIRGILLKGIGMSFFWTEVTVLFGLGLVLLAVSVRKFSTQLT